MPLDDARINVNHHARREFGGWREKEQPARLQLAVKPRGNHDEACVPIQSDEVERMEEVDNETSPRNACDRTGPVGRW
jgi:hypothetical protein